MHSYSRRHVGTSYITEISRIQRHVRGHFTMTEELKHLLNLQPTSEYRAWLWDNKQWHYRLRSGMRRSISKRTLINPKRQRSSRRFQIIPTPLSQSLTCVLTFPIYSEQWKGGDKNKHGHIFFLSVFCAKLFQRIDINTDSHEPMITLFMEHTC